MKTNRIMEWTREPRNKTDIQGQKNLQQGHQNYPMGK